MGRSSFSIVPQAWVLPSTALTGLRSSIRNRSSRSGTRSRKIIETEARSPLADLKPDPVPAIGEQPTG